MRVSMTASIKLQNVDVFGVDTHARAGSLRQWFVRQESLRASRLPILQGINFEAQAGERIALVGMNGCGKSSLLKVISGNYPIHAGTRDVVGSIVPLIEMGAGFVPELTGLQNIKLSFAYRGRLRYYSKELEEKIIVFSELGDRINLPLKTYSSGMVSRLAFSSAIFQDPEILLLDEVMATGDAGFLEKSEEALRSRIDKAAITLMVSHDAKALEAICNRFVLVHGGRIINDGSAKEIFQQYNEQILKLADKKDVA